MPLELKQSLNLSQQLIMTPQLQQAIKLLQLSRLELLDTLYQEMQENPVLEEQVSDDVEDGGPSGDEQAFEEGDYPEQESEGIPEVTVSEQARDDMDWESYLGEYNTGWSEPVREKSEGYPFENLPTPVSSLNANLMWQLSLSHLNEKQREIGEQIIGNLNEDGYLDIGIEELAVSNGYHEEDVLHVLGQIQKFDPLGVAARDAREAMLIQIRFNGGADTVAEKIIESHLDSLENKKYENIAKHLSIPLSEVIAAASVIRGLEPKPGRAYNGDQTIYISPDIYVYKVGDEYEIVLNDDGLPKLRVNSFYRDILRKKGSLNESAQAYIQDKLKSAAWLIKSIHQRQRTIYKVTESIIKHQRNFLENGVAHLRPLVLRTVAEDIEMHESTVSRVTTNKYVHTPQGVFELKFFFNSSVGGSVGGEMASESVREHIRRIIKSEKPSSPYSDQEIADMLGEMEISVARRTVAKYRELMGVLPSRKRKDPYKNATYSS